MEGAEDELEIRVGSSAGLCFVAVEELGEEEGRLGTGIRYSYDLRNVKQYEKS